VSQEVLGALRDLREQGITILIVEQNVYSALSVASRSYVFETGRIVAESDAASILRNPEILRAYLGA
jgi:branched-chain amino acid transport system ATP-binding protein